jgi:hypothetical protein
MRTKAARGDGLVVKVKSIAHLPARVRERQCLLEPETNVVHSYHI